jgi:CRISPR-associated protein Csc1
MNVYRCTLTLLENTFFSSRELNNFYQTEPMIGNYALAYAFGFARAPYSNRGEIHYHRDLTELNRRKLYVTPAKVIGAPKFSVAQFNATSDTYWSRVEQNAIATDVMAKTKKARPLNYPQIGWIKLLGIGTQARCFIVSKEEVFVPSYIRLGKFMSKAHVRIESFSNQQIKETAIEQATLNNMLLNPLDLPHTAELIAYDTYPIHPVPLIGNTTLSARFVELPDGDRLPLAMRFGVEVLEKLRRND